MFKQTLKKREGTPDYLFFNTTGLSLDTFDEVMEWCSERFGEPAYAQDECDERWGHHSVMVGPEKLGTIWFRHEQDAIEFKLRWV